MQQTNCGSDAPSRRAVAARVFLDGRVHIEGTLAGMRLWPGRAKRGSHPDLSAPLLTPTLPIRVPWRTAPTATSVAIRPRAQVHSVENIGRHYSHTLKAWYDNFQKNKSKPEVAKYPPRLHRLWDIFLAWSVVASGQVRPPGRRFAHTHAHAARHRGGSDAGGCHRAAEQPACACPRIPHNLLHTPLPFHTTCFTHPSRRRCRHGQSPKRRNMRLLLSPRTSPPRHTILLPPCRARRARQPATRSSRTRTSTHSRGTTSAPKTLCAHRGVPAPRLGGRAATTLGCSVARFELAPCL